VIIHGIEEHDLRAALEVANYAYKGNLCFREEPATLSSPQSWRVRLSVKDPGGPRPTAVGLPVLVGSSLVRPEEGKSHQVGLLPCL
jgi:hypothetical protein